MERIYYISSFNPIDQEKGKNYLKSLGQEYYLADSSEKALVIIGDSAIFDQVMRFPRQFFDAFGSRSTIMESPFYSSLASHLANEALSFFTGNVCHLPEVILKSASFGKYDFVPLLADEFKRVDETLLLTMHEYLMCEMREDIASEHLYIHRNTFAYRLKKFKKMTGLDLSRYHDCLTLELFFQFTHHSLPRYN